jgi:hypothetical protein
VVKGSSVIWIQVLFSVQLFVYSMRSFAAGTSSSLVASLTLVELTLWSVKSGYGKYGISISLVVIGMNLNTYAPERAT